MVEEPPALVHWLPPWSWGPLRVKFKSACGIRLVVRQLLRPRSPDDGKTPVYAAGQLAITSGEVTCLACLAAIAARMLEDASG